MFRPFVFILGALNFFSGMANAQVPPLTTAISPVYGDKVSGAQSFLRAFNPTSLNGKVEFYFVSPDGALTGKFTTDIAAGAARQFTVVDILKSINVSGADFIVAARASFDGFVSHVLYNAADGSLTNMPNCNAAIASQTRHMPSVHTARIPAYPSVIGIFNNDVRPATAILSVSDSNTGAKIGEWTTPAIASESTYMVNAETILAAIGFNPSATQFHVNMSLPAGFNGYSQHFVDNTVSKILTNMRDTCVVIADLDLR
jgi:hypothetical protein